MKINHVAMYVNDLEKSKEFYIKYFGAKSNGDIYYESSILDLEDNLIEIVE